MKNDTLKLLEDKNTQLQYKLDEFNPSGFINFLQKLFFGLRSFKQYKKILSQIQHNNQSILQIKTADFLNKILQLESEYIQRKTIIIVSSEAGSLIELSEKVRTKKFIIEDNIKNWHKVKTLFSETEVWCKNSNDLFIIKEVNHFKNYFKKVEANPLTKMQEIAVVTNEENNLILAGAGSGKTSVMVAKVGYILQKKFAKEDEILILAFNKKAQEELSERIDEKLKVKVDTKTFHSFGLRVVSESAGVKPSLCKWVESQQAYNKLIREIIEFQMKNNNAFYESFMTYFISYFTPYKSREEFSNLGEYYEYIRNYNIQTFKGEQVKSYEECEIANQLFMWGINYEYEAAYEIDTRTVDYRQYTPDFYLPDYGIYIEHFGISRDGSTAPYIDSVRYNEDIIWKINLHNQNQTRLLQTFSYEKSEGILTEKLKEKLAYFNVVINPITVEEALKMFNESDMADKFSRLIMTFIGHYKSNEYTLNELYLRAGNDDKRALAFLDVFGVIYQEYENEKKKCDCIDFDDMISKAIRYVERGSYKSNYKYILVDEFQDISVGRSKLVNVVRKLTSDSNIVVVGDDWQSINRFAGSDISIIQDFETVFGNSKTVNLDYTFRFNSSVSKIATNFILKNPKQISKIIKTNFTSDKPSFYIYWYQSSREQDQYVKKVLSLISKNETGKKKSIMILGRYRFSKPESFKSMQITYKDQFDIKFNTVHGSKGLESDYIILVGMESGKFGFPSQIEDDPLLNLVVSQSDDFLNAEERRLFYVAITRTKAKVFILASAYFRSDFIDELIDDNGLDVYQLNINNADLESCPECEKGFLVKRKGSAHWFYGCTNYPLCNHTQKLKLCPICKTAELKKDPKIHRAFCRNKDCNGYVKLCPQCNSYLVLRNGKYGNFLGCDGYPKCTYSEKLKN